MLKMTLRGAGSALALAGSLVFLPGAALAAADDVDANDADTIVVTAQRRAEASVNVPITVATLSADALETASVDDLSDITKLTPGLRFDFASGFFQPTIRGIGTAVTTSGGGGNVGIYLDGFYSPNPLAADFDLLNVQSIQVLKGPQGTLFGRNTTGGAILVQTAEPSTETAGRIRFSYGRYNEAKAQGYVTVGVSDRVAIDVQGQYRRGDGWQRDISTNRRVGDYENWSLRLGLKAELSDAVSLLLRYEHKDVDDPAPTLASSSYFGPDIASGAPFFAQPGQFTFAKNRIASGSVPEFFRSKSDIFQATLKADLGVADFTSYTQYRRERVNSSIELDYSGVNIFQLGLPNANKTFSQEFLFNSTTSGPLQWTAGLFYFQNDDIYTTFFDNAGSRPPARFRIGGSGTRTSSYAAFIDATYEVSPQLFLTAGVRYANDRVTNAYWNPSLFAGFNPTTKIPVPSISDDRVTPRLVVRYKPDNDTSLYASYTKGYKAAIIDVGGSCQSGVAVCNSVAPETIDAFEVGYKHDGTAFSLELSGFYYDYKNLQVSIFRTGTAEIINAATSEIYGLDGQLRYRANEHLTFNVGAAWTHARYKRFNNAPIYTPCPQILGAAGCIAAGGVSFIVVPTQLRNVTMQRTPEFTGNVGANYRAELGGGELVLSGNLFYSSKFFFGPSGIQFPQKGYETLSLRAQWTDPSDTYTIALWGDNVTNSRYRTQVQYSSFGIGTNWSKPVTYGVEIGAKF